MEYKCKMKKPSRFSEKNTGLLSFHDLKKLHFKLLYWGMFSVLLAVSIICLLPVVWIGLSGFKEVNEMYAIPPTFFPKVFNPGMIAEVFKKVNIFQYFTNSIILIIGCWAFDVILNGLAGYVLSRIKPIGSKVIEILIFWSMLLPGISMVPLYMTFVDVPLLHISLVGSYSSIWIMAGANAFNVMLFRNYFNGISMAYLEAARLDGLSDFGIFMRIIIPLSKPIISVVSIFSFIATWGNFMWPYLLLGNTDKEPVAVMLYKLSASSGMPMNLYMLLLMISIIPMLIMYAIFSKQIIGGLDVGGVKG